MLSVISEVQTKVVMPSCAVIVLTLFFLFLALDAGAREADLLLFIAPVNSLCGVALCTLAFRRTLMWTGILGLAMMAIGPFFTLGLMTEERGLIRQLIVGAITARYTLLAAYCMYRVMQQERGALSAASSGEPRSR